MQSSRWTWFSRKIANVPFAGCLVSAPGAQVSQNYDRDFDNNFTTPGFGHLLVCGTGPTDTMPYRYLLPMPAATGTRSEPRSIVHECRGALRACHGILQRKHRQWYGLPFLECVTKLHERR